MRMNRSKRPLLLKQLAHTIDRDILWIIWDMMTECDRYAWLLAFTGGSIDKLMLALYVHEGHVALFQNHLTTSTFSHLCKFAACRRGHIDILRTIVTCGFKLSTNDLCVAIVHGWYNCVEYMTTVISRDTIMDDERLAYLAGATGYIDIIELLYDVGMSGEYNTGVFIKGAAVHGRLDAIKWLEDCEDFVVFGDDCLRLAAKHGHLHILQYANFPNTPGLFINACRNGHKHIIEWMLAQGGYDTACAITYAAESGPEMMEWLLQHNIGIDNTTNHSHAAKSGNIKSSMWLRDHGIDITPENWYSAIGYNQLPYMKWLKHIEVEHPDGLVTYGMSLKRYACVQWIVFEAIMPYACAYKSACKVPGDGVACIWIKWLYENGLPLDEFVYNYCKREGCSSDALIWMRSKLDKKYEV